MGRHDRERQDFPCDKSHGDALFRFVDDPIVPIDNSPTEREFQNVATLRLNTLFAALALPPGASPGGGVAT